MKTLIILFVIIVILWISETPVNGCDTWIALSDVTANGSVNFTKNSDRILFNFQPLE